MNTLQYKCKEVLCPLSSSAMCLRMLNAKLPIDCFFHKLVLENFSDLVLSDGFKELEVGVVEQMLSIVKNTALEAPAFKAIIMWTNHKLQEREELFFILMRQLTLNNVSSNFQRTHIQTEDLVGRHPECLEVQRYDNRHSEELRHVLTIEEYGNNNNKWVMFDLRFSEQRHLPESIKLPNLLAVRRGATAVRAEKSIFIMGGENQHYDVMQTAEILVDFQHQCPWKKIGSMSEARRNAASVFLNGCVYVSGGWKRSSSCLIERLSSCEEYDPAFDEWKTFSIMNHERSDHGMVTLNGSLLCIGGIGREDQALDSVEQFNVGTEAWVDLSPMLEALDRVAAVVHTSFVYVIGGSTRNNNASQSMQRYQTDCNQWTRLSSLNIGRYAASAFSANNKIYVVGGRFNNSIPTETIEIYDIYENIWKESFTFRLFREADVAIL